MQQGRALKPVTSFLLASVGVGSFGHLRAIKVGHLGHQQTHFFCLSLQQSEGGMAEAAQLRPAAQACPCILKLEVSLFQRTFCTWLHDLFFTRGVGSTMYSEVLSDKWKKDSGAS